MSDTTQLFISAGIWTMGALVAAYFIPKWPAKIAAVALLVGLPFWELPYGYYNFRKQCEEHTKLQVFERFPSQDLICIAHFDLGLYQTLAKAGFRQIEVTERADNAKEYLKAGNLSMVNRREVKSAFCISFENNIRLPWRILRSDTQIVGASDNRPVARQSYVRWDGMWWQSEASPVLGIGGRCFGDLTVPISTLRKGTI